MCGNCIYFLSYGKIFDKGFCKKYLEEKETTDTCFDEQENCYTCRFCENKHTEELITVKDVNIACGSCSIYGMEVSENDCCSNYEKGVEK